MNIELQCCGLAMLVIVILIFITQKSINYTSRRRFLFAALSCVVCLILDITSIVFIYLAEEGRVSPDVTAIVCKLYLFSLVQQSYQGFRYAAGNYFAGKLHFKLKVFYLIWFIIGSVVILALPISFSAQGRVVFSEGPSAMATYVVTLVLIITTIALALRPNERAVRRNSILIWQGSWLIAALIQFLLPELLLVGFAAALGIAIIYAELESPHEYIDRVTGQFTLNALRSYINDLFINERKFSAVVYRIEYNNRNVGFEADQAVLCAVADELGANKQSFVFRNSSKAFTVIYKDSANATEGYTHLSRVINEIVSVPVKLSVSYAPDSEAFASADELMRVLHYCENDLDFYEFMTIDGAIVADMRRYERTVEMINAALEDDRIIVYYQPIYNVEEKKFNSAEALCRIIDEDGNIIPPGQFIPVAEQSGLIIPLGKEVFKKTCKFLADGRARALGIDYIEINLSPSQFDDNDPSGFVQKIMNEYGVNPEWINLEITETDSDSARQFFLKNMNKLIERGVSFSLDDFGTGRSNLDYFVNMPVNIIKFDFSFTQSYFKNEKARYVMESLVVLMNRMGLRIVAEGVETKEQLDAMASLGVTYIQGYYFSRPIDEVSLLKFLEEHNK